MVLAFLRAEIDSERYKEFFPQDGPTRDVARRLVAHPNLRDPLENEMRRGLLRYRGYGWGGALFLGLPGDVAWQRIDLELEEVAGARYANYPTWIELSGAPA